MIDKALNTIVGLLMILLPLIAAGEDYRILEIRKEYKSIIEKQPHFQKVDTTYFDLSVEGAEVLYFFDEAGNPTIIEAQIFGESGNVEEKLYLFENKLIFAYRVEKRYLVPLSVKFMDPKERAEMGVTEADLEKKETIENRFYFRDGKMIRWVDEKGVLQTTDARMWKKYEKYCLDSAKDYINKITGAL